MVKIISKHHLIFICVFNFLSFFVQAQTKIVTWNIENFGKSKTAQEITFIANTIRDFDVAAIQEVVAGYGGAQAVGQLADELNRKGAKWNYIVSDPTTGSSYKKERYAFLWKTHKVKLKGSVWLEQKFKIEIDREPCYATFIANGKEFTLANYHAITKSKQPETEIKYFKFLPSQYPHLNLIFVGDFNCPQSHSVFNPLKKMGYTSVFKGQKTSLKKDCHQNNCLASEFDNIWLNPIKNKIVDRRIIPFYQKFELLSEARVISDHVPLFVELEFL